MSFQLKPMSPTSNVAESRFGRDFVRIPLDEQIAVKEAIP